MPNLIFLIVLINNIILIIQVILKDNNVRVLKVIVKLKCLRKKCFLTMVIIETKIA